MPVATVTILSTFGVLLMTGASAVVVFATSNPGITDIVAVIGAMLAAAVSLIVTLKQDKGKGTIVSVIISSSLLGGLGPGFVVDILKMFNVISHELAETISWRIYALAGFIVGLGGWGAVMALIRLLNRGTSQAEKLAEKYIDSKLPPS